MLTAKDVMNPNVLTVEVDSPVLRAAELMLERGINGLPVLGNEGALVGVIGIKDVLRMPLRKPGRNTIVFFSGFEKMANMLNQVLVSEVMSRPVVVVSEDTTLGEITSIILERGIHPVPVLRDGQMVGIIGRSDLVRAMVSIGRSDRPAAGAA